MRFFRTARFVLPLLLLCSMVSPSWAKTKSVHHKAASSGMSSHSSHGRRHSTSGKLSRTSSKSKRGKKNWRSRGQKSITDDRTREIQEALIREKYLSGEPSGEMDPATKQALMRLQEENGWQTKIVPDSRALIKLGLGPSHENLLNPNTAAVPAAAVAAKQGMPETVAPQRQ